ncbi:hypothetical protein FH608_046390 [Nonomuraea phyllanthi]|uniref:Uncharacterized protein n=2 Tax=Nonomuraea phyllanthi TaxID=2219224 RepID=A0A5C4V6K3_9ACTN|nr:hypothetical protein FH608_046390 [Nonomuraea phyllanthi]
MIWLPKEGQVIAKVPPRKGNFRWLHHTLEIRSPSLEGDRWSLPRNCLMKFVMAAIDRFGYVAVYRDMSKLSRCTKSCLDAMGMECDCSCLGAHHGESSGGWFERVGDAVVADLGEIARTKVVYGPKGAEGGAQVYRGQLQGRTYSVTRAGRSDWPKAADFMCPSCVTARAQVWDHCHTHGFVRAPLCNPCNTRHWSGWRPVNGRAMPSHNLDTNYYRWCPRHGERGQACSA